MSQWRQVPGWPDYEISDSGEVRRLTDSPYGRKKGQPLTWTLVSGYPSVMLSNKGSPKRQLVHRLVARAFIGEPQLGQEVNHKDGDRKNPTLDNLEWVTRRENMRHAVQTLGRLRGHRNRSAKIGEKEVLEIRHFASLGWGPTAISKEMNLSLSIVRGVISGRTWGYISSEDAPPYNPPSREIPNNPFIVTCSICSCMVARDRLEKHLSWHREGA